MNETNLHVTTEAATRYSPHDGGQWVLRTPCGCIGGVATGIDHPTEDAAWRTFFETKARAAARHFDGYRLERVTSERWETELAALYGKCPHKAAGAA